MSHRNRTLLLEWNRTQATMLAVACLCAGVAGGWSIQGFHAHTSSPGTGSSRIAPSAIKQSPSTATQAESAQLKVSADTQAAPLIERLDSNPENPQVLSELGNLYYDAQQYAEAVDYYHRALKVKPADAAVRTDMATAYWYMGNADLALSEFDKALTFAPGNPNTLFNRGLVKWKGKKDAAGALADWNKLLATDPAYDQKDKVQQMIAEVKGQPSLVVGSKTR